MVNLSSTDLEILHLGIEKKGTFNESDLEKSDLKKMGVGRILDQLASLIERKLIKMNKDGSFTVTDVGRHTLWDSQIPLWIKILKILQIKPLSINKISSFLFLDKIQIQNEVEDLRKRQLVLMSPLRTEHEIVKTYEILPEGIDAVTKAQSQGIHYKHEKIKPQVEILSIIEEIIQEVNETQIESKEKKDKIISDLKKIRDKLEI